ncbi:hypothetical protein APUTEX25_001541 [Auxenochlorella protothecoides]|uniref:Protein DETOXIFICATION n=1 Tax=Auxenochlorella protothecoides TaxID=3075 RepID=A0A1D2A776_AUXPR|nr:hypothetical protein APUTEX25_001541 [Auxenochlorella protothecoides]|eukprot:RMZ52151.1 hypothetical protein APUTEX25_001541 [Auxenochlorella protothecoides]
MDDSVPEYSSWASILGVAAPAVIQSLAAPLTSTLQTAWLGLYGSPALAAYAAVNTSATFALKIFVFFGDGVSAKVGNLVGQKDWHGLFITVLLSLLWSASLGTAAACVLLLLKPLVIHHVLDLEPRVLAVVAAYWTVRAAAVPLAMTNMACTGVLQGLHRVTLCAALNTGQAVAESCLSAAVLLGGVRFLGAGALVSMGWASLLTQAAQLVACLTAVHAALPHQHGSLRGAWAGETGPRQPLLEEEAGEDEPALRAPCADFLPASTAPLLVSDAGGSGTLPPDAAADGTDAHASAPSPANHQQPPTAPASASRAFLDDGVNMLLRSITLQATFFAALVAASRLGTAALAAHSVVAQLWMLSAYAVDGFAAAGIVLGSRLAGAADDSDQGGDAALKSLRRLIRRCCMAGTAFGAATGATYLLFRRPLIRLFTGDAEVAALLGGSTWTLVAAMQPCNGLVFVLDGLMYASHNFAYVRDYMALGFALVFAPALALELWVWPSLVGIWAAKALYNFWRAAGGLNLVLRRFVREVEDRTRRRAPGPGPA